MENIKTRFGRSKTFGMLIFVPDVTSDSYAFLIQAYYFFCRKIVATKIDIKVSEHSYSNG